MTDLITFFVSKTAGPKINGIRHKGAGTPIHLTEGQSVHLLRTGQITKEEPSKSAKAPAKTKPSTEKSEDK